MPKLSDLFSPEIDKIICEIKHNYPNLRYGEYKKYNPLLKVYSNKQIGERWKNNIDPRLCKDPWSYSDFNKLNELQTQYGNRWSMISKIMNRSSNDIKNKWYSIKNNNIKINNPIDNFQFKYCLHCKECNIFCICQSLII